ncbi:MAG: YfiM family protein [Bacteroidales bacterium]|nr:YfiM family protein [Bacteroidales bacterium]MCF8326844.1 YfiM family protein [Bacteroidales bacterium]
MSGYSNTYDPSRKIAVCLFLLILTSNMVFGKSCSPDSTNKKRLTKVLIAQGALYGGSLVGLESLWYSNYSRSSFHFFNDNQEWLQIDKAGHALTGYTLSQLSKDTYLWSGMTPKKASIMGSLAGFSYLTVIEILDGFSTNWGASIGDLAANFAGCGLFLSQELAWQEQKFQLKWSFHTTQYAEKNPSMFGNSLPVNMLKDYNGQTTWLSFHPMLNKENSFIPLWLNIAAGYSANGMLNAVENKAPWQDTDRYRQYLLSLDINWRKIPTNSKTLKFVFKTLSFIKIPFPAIEFSEKGIRTHGSYF